MDFESTVKYIKKVYGTLTGKSDAEVIMTYKGTGYGVTKPWHIKIENRETQHEKHDGAAQELLGMLKKELNDKVVSAERQAVELRQALNSLGN